MKTGLTEIVLVLDRSGSMEAIRTDAEGGLREFIRKQKETPGEARVTFYRFDNVVERVFDNRAIHFVREEELELHPRSLTALLDAMGRAINEVGERLRNTPENERPENVVFLTITDGIENASREFDRKRIQDLIRLQRDTYKWNFIFIGCSESSIALAEDIGIPISMTLQNAPTRKSYMATYGIMAQNVTALRSGGGAQSLSFTGEQRNQVKDSDQASSPIDLSKLSSGSVVSGS